MKTNLKKITIIFLILSLFLSVNFNKNIKAFAFSTAIVNLVPEFGNWVSSNVNSIMAGIKQGLQLSTETANTLNTVYQVTLTLATVKMAYEQCMAGEASQAQIRAFVTGSIGGSNQYSGGTKIASDLSTFINTSAIAEAYKKTLEKTLKDNNLYSNDVAKALTQSIKDADLAANTFTLPYTVRDEVCNSDTLKSKITKGDTSIAGIKKTVNFGGTSYSDINDMCSKNSDTMSKNAQAQFVALYTNGYAGDKSRVAAANPVNTPEGQKKLAEAQVSATEAVNKQLNTLLATKNGGVLGVLNCIKDGSSVTNDPTKANDPSQRCDKFIEDIKANGANVLAAYGKDQIEQFGISAAVQSIFNVCRKSTDAVANSLGINLNDPRYKDIQAALAETDKKMEVQIKANIDASNKADPNSGNNLLDKFKLYLKNFTLAKNIEEQRIGASTKVIQLINSIGNTGTGIYDQFMTDKKTVCTSQSTFTTSNGQNELACDGQEIKLGNEVVTSRGTHGDADTVEWQEQAIVPNTPNALEVSYNDSDPIKFNYDTTTNPLWRTVKSSFVGSSASTNWTSLKTFLTGSVSSSTAKIAHYQENIDRLNEIISYIDKAPDQKLSDVYTYDDLVKEGEVLTTNIGNIQTSWTVTGSDGLGGDLKYNFANSDTELGMLLAAEFKLFIYLGGAPSYTNVFSAYANALTTNTESPVVGNKTRLQTILVKATGAYSALPLNQIDTAHDKDLYFMLRDKQTISPVYGSDGKVLEGSYTSNGGWGGVSGSTGGDPGSCNECNPLCIVVRGPCNKW